MVKTHDFINSLDNQTLIEIMDIYNGRIFYGKVAELDIETWRFLYGSSVAGANCFMAETGIQKFEPALQIFTDI